MWRTGTHIYCWGKYELLKSVWETVWQYLLKLNICIPYAAAILLLGIYPTEIHKCVCQKACTRIFIAALFIIAQTRNKPYVHQQWNG